MQFDTKSNIYNDKGNLTFGTLIKYHYGFNDHVVAIAVQYQNGQRNGFSKTFDECGRLMSERTFKNGALNGVSQFFDTNGNLIRECFYENDHLVNTTLCSPKEPEPVEYVCEKRPRKKFPPLDD